MRAIYYEDRPRFNSIVATMDYDGLQSLIYGITTPIINAGHCTIGDVRGLGSGPLRFENPQDPNRAFGPWELSSLIT